MITQSSIRRRVNRGVALLNKLNPGWLERVDENTLDIRNEYRCPLGQVYIDYASGCDAIGISISSTNGIKKRANLGFTVSDMDDSAGETGKLHEKLTATWKRAILKLKSQKKEPKGRHTIEITEQELKANYTNIHGCPLHLALSRVFRMPANFTISSYGRIHKPGCGPIGKAINFDADAVYKARDLGGNLEVVVEFN